jgi:hypothetical protein
MEDMLALMQWQIAKGKATAIKISSWKTLWRKIFLEKLKIIKHYHCAHCGSIRKTYKVAPKVVKVGPCPAPSCKCTKYGYFLTFSLAEQAQDIMEGTYSADFSL